MTAPICNECWFGDCKNCTGRNCWHADRGEHYDKDIPVKLSDGHAWLPAAAVDLLGEDLIRRVTGADHIHPVNEDIKRTEETR